uniref:Conotoxin Cl9.5 n=1 Tax=Californiconus californicus TaxID=1736779 RepID=CU95_CONCL
MNCYLILTVALLLTSAMTGTTTAGQLNTKGVTLREDDRTFPCSSGLCACLPLDSYSYICLSPSSSTANCENDECISEDDW